MKKLFSLMALGQALSVSSTYATSHTDEAATADSKERQQTRVAACNSVAKGMKSDERKAFIRSCLSIDGKPPPQAKITVCNVEAKGLKGDERKAFMSNCLKKEGTGALGRVASLPRQTLAPGTPPPAGSALSGGPGP